MQSRAGLLYLSKTTGRILLILEDSYWTVPTFARTNGLIADAELLFQIFSIGKLVPIELYLSKDRGFEYGTYICLVEKEFLTETVATFCWADLNNLPKNLHHGLKTTLSNSIIKTKIDTVLALESNYSK